MFIRLATGRLDGLHRRRRRVKPTIDSRRGYFKSHLVNYFIQFVFTLPDVIVGRYSFCLLDQPQILSLIIVVVQHHLFNKCFISA